jgi:hypothetical protein
MISTNSLAAFTAEVSRSQRPAPVRAASPAPLPAPGTETTRRLESLPPQPMSPLPRGSLLDMKV